MPLLPDADRCGHHAGGKEQRLQEVRRVGEPRIRPGAEVGVGEGTSGQAARGDEDARSRKGRSGVAPLSSALRAKAKRKAIVQHLSVPKRMLNLTLTNTVC